ncbi:MAG: serine hydrolase domain-containing protein, partial [Bacteroidota bacterium]
ESDSVRNLIFTDISTKETELYPYYLGLSQDNYHGLVGYGHGGFWGTVMLYFPAINTAVSVAILERDERALRRDVLEAVLKVMREQKAQHLNRDEALRGYLAELTDFSGTVMIAHEGEITASGAFGLANIEGAIKNKLDTKFNVASISKLITAVATLQLWEQGKIDLQAKVGTYLPTYPHQLVKDSVSVRHLLTHSSGIPPFYGEDYLKSDKLKYQKVADFVPLFADKELNFSPGTKYQYSGSGFVVLGRIIESVAGMDYYEYIEKHVFEQAGMTNSLAIPVDSLVTNKANGYTCLWGDQDYLSRNDYYISKASPAGGHYATAADLLAFMQALRNGRLLKPATQRLLTTPQIKGYNTHLGYGIDVDRRYQERIVGHSGGWFGVRTEVMDFLASGYLVVVLSNLDDDGESGASRVIDDLKRIIAGSKRT